jgi:hypothetical protein
LTSWLLRPPVLRDLWLDARIGWLRRRFELVVLVSAFVPAEVLFAVGERLLLTSADLEAERAARRRLR